MKVERHLLHVTLTLDKGNSVLTPSGSKEMSSPTSVSSINSFHESFPTGSAPNAPSIGSFFGGMNVVSVVHMLCDIVLFIAMGVWMRNKTSSLQSQVNDLRDIVDAQTDVLNEHTRILQTLIGRGPIMTDVNMEEGAIPNTPPKVLEPSKPVPVSSTPVASETVTTPITPEARPPMMTFEDTIAPRESPPPDATIDRTRPPPDTSLEDELAAELAELDR